MTVYGCLVSAGVRAVGELLDKVSHVMFVEALAPAVSDISSSIRVICPSCMNFRWTQSRATENFILSPIQSSLLGIDVANVDEFSLLQIIVDLSFGFAAWLLTIHGTSPLSNELRVIAETMEVDYLGPAAFPGKFPAVGRIKGQNHRLMVPLVCRRQTTKQAPSVNIIFLIDTGSPVTYLCHEAMEALIGKDSHLPQSLYVKIHSEEAIETHLSPKGSHFVDVNVLGMDFLAKNRVFPIPDWTNGTFILQ
ncbi:hypothetical protein CcCBS67573_g10238 [Chytriomyces confervae]|uniref:Uncharacterized protein n=1 Tax=Chytriomyces confervae TaxID=246404 RepID=A0A507D8G3_9FUNG|nr:hypothetical protein CcCBS67573_g10238 [Chytriomyces confervae]